MSLPTPMEQEITNEKQKSSDDKRPSITARSPDLQNREKEQDGTIPPAISASQHVEHWNQPRRNIYKTLASFWAFMVIGMNDATPGAILPYLQTYYRLRYTTVSLIFLSPVLGCVLSIFLNNTIHLRLGQRGIAFIGAISHIIAYVVIAVHPPYPVLVICYALAGFANGLEDAAWNAWIGAMGNANEILGFLHAFYGAGAMISPAVATALITKAKSHWYHWYYCMIGFACLELVVSLHAFWPENAVRFRETHAPPSGNEDSGGGSRLKEAILKMPAARTTWLCTFFLLGAMGVEISLGGWIVEFMLQVRHAKPYASGMAATGFWLGMTIGRIALGFVTPKLGEKLAVMIYIPIAIIFELLFWLVPQFYVSAIAVAFQGFFIGPLFPAAIVVCMKILPSHLHVSSIGFATAVGGVGGSIFPYAIGAIAQVRGVKVLQPIVLALFAVIWLLWVALMGVGRKR